jgi:ERCC4-type nuclease
MIAANQCADRSDIEDASADAKGHRPAHVLRVDFSERSATLVDLARKCGDFDVRTDRLDVGDYCVDGGVVIERKTYLDFAMSLADGRLFPQAAALARSPHRCGPQILCGRLSQVPELINRTRRNSQRLARRSA